MSPIGKLGRWLALSACMAAGLLGCSDDPDVGTFVDPTTIPLVPVNGTVTLDGKPLASAVVSFMPERGATFVGETDEDGRYVIGTVDRAGTPVGDFKVAVSYLVAEDGEPQGLDIRSAMIQPPSMLKAKEQLPERYANLGRTVLSARVGPRGGTFDFALESDAAKPDSGQMPEPREDGETKAGNPPSSAN